MENRIIIVDVEATCWETKEEQGQHPNEVIEIGACELDLTSGVISKLTSIAVKPEFTYVNDFCTQLTGWTQQTIDAEGLTIQEALAAFTDIFNPTDKTMWGSYGAYDRNMLGSRFDYGSLGKLYGVKREENPFEYMAWHVNIKDEVACFLKLDRGIGMAKALGKFGLTLEGRHHNGADDAYNIAKIRRHMLGLPA